MPERAGIVGYSDDPTSLAMAMNLGHTALAMGTAVLVYFTFVGLTHRLAGERDLGEFERMVEADVPNPCDMLAEFVGSGGETVTTVACTTPLDMLDRGRENLDDGVVTQYAGAATFLRGAEDANHVFSFG